MLGRHSTTTLGICKVFTLDNIWKAQGHVTNGYVMGVIVIKKTFLFSLVFPKHTYWHHHFLRCEEPLNYHLWRLKKNSNVLMTTLELDLFIGLLKWVPPSTTSMLFLFAKSFVHLSFFIFASFTHSFTKFFGSPFCKPLSLHLCNVLSSHWNFFITPLSSSLLVVFVIFFVSFFQNKHTSFTKALAKS